MYHDFWNSPCMGPLNLFGCFLGPWALRHAFAGSWERPAEQDAPKQVLNRFNLPYPCSLPGLRGIKRGRGPLVGPGSSDPSTMYDLCRAAACYLEPKRGVLLIGVSLLLSRSLPTPLCATGAQHYENPRRPGVWVR